MNNYICLLNRPAAQSTTFPAVILNSFLYGIVQTQSNLSDFAFTHNHVREPIWDKSKFRKRQNYDFYPFRGQENTKKRFLDQVHDSVWYVVLRPTACSFLLTR